MLKRENMNHMQSLLDPLCEISIDIFNEYISLLYGDIIIINKKTKYEDLIGMASQIIAKKRGYNVI